MLRCVTAQRRPIDSANENNCQAINNFSHAHTEKKEVRECHSTPNHIIYQVFEVGYILYMINLLIILYVYGIIYMYKY